VGQKQKEATDRLFVLFRGSRRPGWARLPLLAGAPGHLRDLPVAKNTHQRIARAYWFGPGRDLDCGAMDDVWHGRLSSTPLGVFAAGFSSSGSI
jgi:hypothetical protein